MRESKRARQRRKRVIEVWVPPKHFSLVEKNIRIFVEGSRVNPAAQFSRNVGIFNFWEYTRCIY